MWRLAWVGVLLLAGCSNSPYPPAAAASNTLYTAFTEHSPHHLDPTASYWSNESPFTYQVYEPLYGVHYLHRPYRLVPKTAAALVKPTLLDRAGHVLPDDAPAVQVAESVYDIPLQPGIRYQPHPAFATDAQGRLRYHQLTRAEIATRRSPLDFPHQGTRELVAEDYVYALKRHATTRVPAPFLAVLTEHVVGMQDYAEQVRREDARLLQGHPPGAADRPFLDFRRWPLAGVSAPGRHRLRIRLKGRLPQWDHWMATTFLAPVPWEADAFYAQPGMARQGLSLDRWPVGTGPYYLVVSEQDRRHVLARNPHYRGVPYPCDGTDEDRTTGRLADCGRPTPFIDRVEFRIEPERLAVRGKFLQGYLDVPLLDRDEWGAALQSDMADDPDTRRDFTARGLQLPRYADLSVYYLGFNLDDPVVGWGQSDAERARHRALRQAISIAIDWEERSRIFPTDAGETAMSPIPPGLFGSPQGQPGRHNPITHRATPQGPQRRPIADAQALMVAAGHPGGRDSRTGHPLVLHYDYFGAPTPERKADLDWMVRQFAKLGIRLDVRATDHNQFQEKVRRGQHQIYWSGWLADYPDAENFLALLHGPNGKAVSGGENLSNYASPAFDRDYVALREVPDGPPRQARLDAMVRTVQEDAPWSFGYFPSAGGAYQRWVRNAKPSSVVRDGVRYLRLDVADRVAQQRDWNAPQWAVPVGLVVFGAGGLAWAGWRWQRRRQRQTLRALHRAGR
ncbi:ABC transporter substrate-binding protein [Sphaerotilus sp.]|uniref:ABC transporter substrate-binding protein n=1 Tax=Sphaerotilus sp. TaxID=2093942 RepID=UPI0025FDCC66|nr:ABC transporter substrate-binding protein [Sphaerotilus sp.]